MGVINYIMQLLTCVQLATVIILAQFCVIVQKNSTFI